jgi:hypothetical protein
MGSESVQLRLNRNARMRFLLIHSNGQTQFSIDRRWLTMPCGFSHSRLCAVSECVYARGSILNDELFAITVLPPGAPPVKLPNARVSLFFARSLMGVAAPLASFLHK